MARQKRNISQLLKRSNTRGKQKERVKAWADNWQEEQREFVEILNDVLAKGEMARDEYVALRKLRNQLEAVNTRKFSDLAVVRWHLVDRFDDDEVVPGFEKE